MQKPKGHQKYREYLEHLQQTRMLEIVEQGPVYSTYRCDLGHVFSVLDLQRLSPTGHYSGCPICHRLN